MKRENERQIKKNLSKILGVLALCLIMPLLFSISAEAKEAEESQQQEKVQQTERIYEINTFEEFLIFAMESQTLDYEGQRVVLNKDLYLTDADIKAMLEEYGVTHLTVGTKDRPFKGTFDGQNHRIKGLVYEPNIIKDPNSGLFSFTDGATIQNLTLENADIEAIYQGGIVVGHAKNTHLENLTVLNSKIKMSPANNVISLITNLGFCGGGIAGIMEDSVMYNCEISGTEVVNNSTSGVTGVGGEGLYMGGLVGWAEDSTIEYSRVRSNYVGESNELQESVVRNDYDIAVGALGGKSVYAGGIVGGVNTADGETRIVDCFCTADVSFYAANYVAVGSGIAGYAGGITGALRGNSHIERCHYAGNIHSKQYNAILVIPIIQTDVNISGIANIKESQATVTDSYFKRSESSSSKTIRAVEDWNDTPQYSAKDDKTYEDREFWKDHDYDFEGTKIRGEATEHINKWVMDYDLGIPVHGSHMSVTFDFPGAGVVSVDPTALVNEKVSTDDAYHFAVQGIHPRGDVNATLEVNPVDSNPEDKITEYEFAGWFKQKDVGKDSVSDMSELEAITHAEGAEPVSQEQRYTFKFGNNETDKDLYIACLKARIAFHELDGMEMTSDTKYYTYRENLADVVPTVTPDGAVFYGWTTEPNPDESGGGYSAITSGKLEELLNKGAIYHAGDPVEKTMELYPIFTSYITNIKTVFEGHEQDESELVSERQGVGHTSIGSDDTGVFIQVTGAEADGAFPAGYRFLGWYQQIGVDEQGQPIEARVSNEQTYYVPDVSKEVTYTARFEYLTDYYANTKDNDKVDGEYQYWNFYSEWVRYQSIFDYDRAADMLPLDYSHHFTHWSLEEHGVGKCSDSLDQIPNPYSIVAPASIYAHWSDNSDYNITVLSDFPNAAKLSMWGKPENPVNKLTVQAEPKSGYQFIFWAGEENQSLNNNKFSSKDMTWEVDKAQIFIPTNRYIIKAHLAASLNFHYKTDIVAESEMSTVWRRYEDPVFQKTQDIYTGYTYPYSGDPVGDGVSLVRDASPSDDQMLIKNADGTVNKNYEFLGWIQAKEANSQENGGIVKGGAEWNYIYDVENDQYCTSDADKALPYLLKDDAVVTETMELYPVYVKYDIKTTTNIHQMAKLPNGVQYPNVPSYELVMDENTGKGTATITLTAETNVTPVREGEDAKYELVGFKCTLSDGKVTDLWGTGTPNGNSYTFQMTVEAGKSYTFMSIYNPAFVVYHMDGQSLEDSTHLETRNVGQPLGLMPEINYDRMPEELKNAYMIGWTEEKPNGWYHYYASKEAYDQTPLPLVNEKTTVEHSMDLWPVFVQVSAEVNSNIDQTIQENGGDPATVRYVQNDHNVFSLVAKEYAGYAFKGWYTGYVSDEDPGTLLTEESTYLIPESELFANGKYTAVYAQSIDINYYDFNGNIIYTAKTTADENRTFVSKDPEDPKKEVPIDTEAFVQIEEKIKEIQEASGRNLKFVEWRWWNEAEQKYVSWEEFKDTEVTQSMNLYPVAYAITFLDSEESVYDGMVYSVSEGEDGTRELNTLFTKKYTQPEINIAVEEVAGQHDTPAIMKKGIQGIRTNVYMSGEPDKEGNPTYVSASEGSVPTDENGMAVHKLYGRLVVRKSYIGLKTDGMVLVNVQKLDDSGSPDGALFSVPLAVKDGEGRTEVKLPLGNYRVSEDMTWAWRDQADSVMLNGQAQTGFDQSGTTDVTIDILQPEIIVYGNARQNEKWFSDFCEMKNVFGSEVQAGGN